MPIRPPPSRLTAEILGVPERGEQLAAYAEATFADIDQVLAKVPPGRAAAGLPRPRPGWPGDGSQGLDQHGDHRARRPEISVADAGSGRQGIAQLQLEQILAWNPDTIVTWDDRFYRTVNSDPAWAGVAAVRKGRVSLSPGLPFGWIDRPPSLNRLIGLKWLVGVFYPDQTPADLRAETREFTTVCSVRSELDEAQLDRLLGPAGGQAPDPAHRSAPRRPCSLPGRRYHPRTAAGPYPLSPSDIAQALWRRLAGGDGVLSRRHRPVRRPTSLIGSSPPRGCRPRSRRGHLQNLFRNPLVSPDILAGSRQRQAWEPRARNLLSLPVFAIQALAFAGGLATVALVYLVAAAVRGREPCSSWSWPAWSWAPSPAR